MGFFRKGILVQRRNRIHICEWLGHGIRELNREAVARGDGMNKYGERLMANINAHLSGSTEM